MIARLPGLGNQNIKRSPWVSKHKKDKVIQQKRHCKPLNLTTSQSHITFNFKVAADQNDNGSFSFCKPHLDNKNKKYKCAECDFFFSFLVVDTRSVGTTNAVGQNMQICHSLRCKQNR
mgnify:CR=1 FL=1